MKIGVYRKRLWTSALVGIVVAIIATCAFDVVKVDGSAMEPDINEGSTVLVNRIAYLYQQPKVGDIIAVKCDVYSEDGEGSVLIRRVAATEGDKVKIQDGNLYINDSVYTEYAEQSMYLEDMSEVTIQKNRIYVLGDQKTTILDSRNQAVGQLRVEELNGKICFK